jgi:membrane protease YdiL (CAAX protease family)
MHFISYFSAGFIGEIQLLPFLSIINILCQKILSTFGYIWHINLIKKHPLLLLYSEVTHQSQFWSMLLLATILVPIAEEIIFRYFLYRYCKFCMSPGKAMLLTSFIFALIHFNLAAFLPIFVMGIFLIFLYERYGNIIPCIILHGIHNCLVIIIAISFPKLLWA